MILALVFFLGAACGAIAARLELLRNRRVHGEIIRVRREGTRVRIIFLHIGGSYTLGAHDAFEFGRLLSETGRRGLAWENEQRGAP